MNTMKKRGCQILVLFMTAGMLTGCGDGTPKLEDALKKTASYEMKTVEDPASDALGGEWTVMALARSGEEVDENYFEKYRANVEKRVKEQEGVLSENRYTEYSRAVLALKSIGKDPTDIGGYDIEKPLEDFDTVVSQGLNGAIYALLALNADDPDANKDGELEQKYLDYIVEKEKDDGGFSLDDNATNGDVDLTAMTLQCLEPYQDENDVKEVIDKGVEFLADTQDDDGGYTAYGAKSSESISQTVIALSAVGVDCNEDERFQKDGKGLYDTLMTFCQKDGSFKHILDGESDPMATDQAFCAMVAYQRYQNKKNSFFDMTDHRYTEEKTVPQKITELQEQLETIIKGKKEITDKILMAVLAKGHVLLEDVPGVGKTTTALALSRLMGMDFNRIQFTPDVVPSDVTGFTMYDKQSGQFLYRPGAVMCNLLLADEINRTSSKTQSALLEVMEEGRVTVDGETHTVPAPFVVIATENPVGSSGTQLLPESQLDRFMISVSMGYPDHQSLVELLRDRQKVNPLEHAKTVLTREEVLNLQKKVQEVYVADVVLDYIAKLAEATRDHELITLGLSPRGTLALCRMTKAAAYMKERDYVVPQDVKDVFKDVAAHRMILDSKARYQEKTAREILDEILDSVPEPKVEG